MSDHPQLTAYLLGELSPVESAALEQQLAASPELQLELDALRQTVAALESAFAQHIETQPAVPAIDREKLHSLLRSAVVVERLVERTPTSVPPGPGGPGYGATGHGSTVAVPALLAAAPPSPARGATSRNWLVAGAVLVVGGLIGISQWEVGPGERSLARVQSSPRDRETLELQSWAIANGRGAEPLSQVELLAEQKLSESVASNGVASRTVVGAGLVPMHTSAPMDAFSQDEYVVGVTGASGRVRNLSIADPNLAATTFGDSVTDGWSGAAANSNFGTTLLGRAPRYRVPSDPSQPVPNNYSYYTHKGPSADFRGLGATRPELAEQSDWGASQPSAGRNFGQSLFDDGASVANGESRSNFLMLAEPEIDAFGSTAPIPRRFTTSPDDVEFYQLNQVPDPNGLMDLYVDSGYTHESLGDVDGEGPVALGKTPGIVVPEAEEVLLGIHAESAAEVDALARPESLSAAVPQLQQALPQSLTVADYENGFIQLSEAVKGWSELNQHWDRQRVEALSRRKQPAPLNESAPSGDDFIEVTELSKLVADQQAEFKKLREATPDIAGKPLTEANPEVAKQAELALVRVRRELNRQQAVWYYREGYIRQLEATLAAAEQYAHVPENDFVTPEAQPLSTFGIDVDTASYSNVRRFVEAGQLPPPDAVRIEELINSFQYEGPKVEGDAPLAVAAEVSVCPWQPQHQLLRVALKGKSVDLQQRPPARLVFLVDTSGSMSDENKLPLVKQSLRVLVEQMREQDRLSIVTYSDNAGLLLDSTGGDKREAILAAIEGLNADGSTNGEAGLKLAYEVAVKQFGEGATNRVMLCTDGDFNVGESADSELVKLIEKQRQTGVFLNIFGFGSGNLKDAKLEAIADKGNGQYIYIDGIKEARKTLLNELTGTLYTIAKDVKLQIEFNPDLVGSYRLVGYENRVMAAKDFANDKVDSGDMGAGHSVVALYEIVPPGAPQPVAPQPETEPLKYKRAGSVSARSEEATALEDRLLTSEVSPATETPPGAALTPSPSPEGRGDPEGAGGQPADPAAEAPKPADPLATELCTIRVRYKQPTSNESTKIETVVSHPHMLRGGQPPVSRDHVWATAVAEFGLVTKHSSFLGTGNYSQILELAQSALGDDPTGQRREFITLVRQAQHLTLKHEARLAELSDHIEGHRRTIQQIKAVEQAPELMTKASCSGKYKTLLRQIEVADDQPTYGEFKDFGRWEGHEYKTHQNLPNGYWVYVAPHWYIWGESTEQASVK